MPIRKAVGVMSMDPGIACIASSALALSAGLQ